MIPRIRNILGGILLLVLVGLGLYAYIEHREVAVAKTVTVNAKADTHAAKVHEAATAKVVAHQEQLNADLQQAVSEHQAWADEPVPSSIADVLRKPVPKTGQ